MQEEIRQNRERIDWLEQTSASAASAATTMETQIAELKQVLKILGHSHHCKTAPKGIVSCSYSVLFFIAISA